MRYREHNVASRPSRRMGGHTDLGFTQDRHQMCASRVNPTCDVRDPRTRAAESGRPKIAAPHTSREGPRVHQLIEIRFRP